MVIVKDQLDPNLRKIIKKEKKAIIIPVGSIEQHGPHLPVSTDSDIVTEVAKQVSEKCNFFLLPTLSYGVSFEHAPFFNLSLKEKTLEQILIDICLSLSSNDINTIFIINGHHGNQKALENLSKKINKISKKKIKVFVFSYWHFMKHEFDHAGFVETSLMLAISKKVKMNRAKKGLITKNLSENEKSRLGKLASKSFPSVTKNGVWGDPTKSTAKEGRKFLAEIVRNLAKKSQTCLTDKSRKLHH
jgi:creatinine amidohydrolase